MDMCGVPDPLNMRLGQTTSILFASKILGSLIGFLAMVYFARVLGSSVLGVYFLVLALIGWLRLVNNLGLSRALNKRVSEGVEKGQHILAALSLYAVAYAIIALFIYLGRDWVNAYLGEQLHHFVILFLGANILFIFVNNVMRGEQLVHAQGIVSLFQTILRVLFQVSAVLMGFAVSGLLFGEIVAILLGSVVGVVVTLVYFNRSFEFKRPTRTHYESLIDFAKFSWLGDMKGKIYQRMDIIVLGFFSPSSLIGIYSICWNLAQFLEIFSKSISTTMFPKMSELSSDDHIDLVSARLEDALSYSGLFIIPGLAGVIVVGDGVLNIYGGEFRQGQIILVLLVGATLVHGYHKQLMNTLDALNRPDLTFAVNVFFAVTNISLNVILVSLYGWVGAAVATLISVVAAMLIAYRMLSVILSFNIPVQQILYQSFAAAMMGGFVFGLDRLLISQGLTTRRLGPVLLMVGVGVLIYFSVLLLISRELRDVVTDNISL